MKNQKAKVLTQRDAHCENLVCIHPPHIIVHIHNCTTQNVLTFTYKIIFHIFLVIK